MTILGVFLATTAGNSPELTRRLLDPVVDALRPTADGRSQAWRSGQQGGGARGAGGSGPQPGLGDGQDPHAAYGDGTERPNRWPT